MSRWKVYRSRVGMLMLYEQSAMLSQSREICKAGEFAHRQFRVPAADAGQTLWQYTNCLPRLGSTSLHR